MRLSALELLERFATRNPRGVRESFDAWSVLDWFAGIEEPDQAASRVARVGLALLEQEPEWSWGLLVEVYGICLERKGYRPIHQEIAAGLAAGASEAPATVAERFERRFAREALPKLAMDLVRAHGELWLRQWRAQGASAAAVVSDLLPALDMLDDLPLAARLRALCALLKENGDRQGAEALIGSVAAAADRRLLAKWWRIAVEELLGEPGSEAAEALLSSLALALREGIRAGMTGEVRIAVSAVVASPLEPSQLRGVLGSEAEVPAAWLDENRFLPLCRKALAAGLEVPQKVVRDVIAHPEGVERSVRRKLSAQLSLPDLEGDLSELALAFVLATADVMALLNVTKGLGDADATRFADRSSAVASLIREQGATNPSPVLRRAAVDSWVRLVDLGLLEPPPQAELGSRFEGENDYRVQLSWLQLMAVRPAPSDVPEVFRRLFAATTAGTHPALEERARNLLPQLVGEAEDPALYLSEVVEAVVRPTVGAERVGWLGKALSRLCQPSTVGSVLEAVERIFDACSETGMRRGAQQDVGNKLAGLVRRAFRLASDGQRRRLVERCRDWEPELARVPVAAVFALPDAGPRGWLDELLADATVPDKTRDLIRKHKYYTERPGGSAGYPELYRIASAGGAGPPP